MKYRILIVIAGLLCFTLAFGPAAELAGANDYAFIPVITLIIV